MPELSLRFFNSKSVILGLIFKGIVKRQTKWRWSNFSVLSIFELRNSYQFLSKIISKFLPPPLPSGPCKLPFDFMLMREAEKSILYYLCDLESYMKLVVNFFYLINMNRHMESFDLQFSSVYLSQWLNFFFVPQDLIDNILMTQNILSNKSNIWWYFYKWVQNQKQYGYYNKL